MVRSIATTMRVPALLLVTIVIGVLAGSGLALLAEARPNDPCLDFGSLPEGSSSGGAFEPWPPRLHCDYYVGRRLARSTSFGPQTVELYAWIGAAALLAAFALLRRQSAFLRGAATMAGLLAIFGAVWFYADATAALTASVVFGAPVAFLLDHRLRPGAVRSRGASLYVAIALAGLAFCGVFGVIVWPLAAIAVAVTLGGLVGARLAQVPPARVPET